MSDASQPGSVKRLNSEADDDAGQRDDVGQELMLEVDGEQHDQRAAEHQPRRRAAASARNTTTPPANIAPVSASTIG